MNEELILKKENIITSTTDAKEYFIFIEDNFEEFKIDQIRITADHYEIHEDYTAFYLDEVIVGLIKTSSMKAIFDKTQVKLYGRYYNKETKFGKY